MGGSAKTLAKSIPFRFNALRCNAPARLPCAVKVARSGQPESASKFGRNDVHRRHPTSTIGCSARISGAVESAGLNAIMLRTTLSSCNLRGADLSGADLRDVVFADLTDANLTKGNLTRADFTGADLTGANFTGSDISDADFSGAILKNVNGLASAGGISYAKNFDRP